MSTMFSTIFDETMCELDVEETTKQTSDILKTKNSGVTNFCRTRIQSLKRELENLSMEDEEMILNYFGKLTRIVVEMRG